MAVPARWYTSNTQYFNLLCQGGLAEIISLPSFNAVTVNSFNFFNFDVTSCLYRAVISIIGNFTPRGQTGGDIDCRGQSISWVKGSVCFVLKFAFPPFSPTLPSGVQISKQNMH